MSSDQEHIDFFAAEEEQDVSSPEEDIDSGDEDMITFWNAQPVPVEVTTQIDEGALTIKEIEHISTTPAELPPGNQWCTIDPLNLEHMNDLWELLNGQYVEDADAMFRFNYSKVMLKWALTAPGWRSTWHIGIRSTTSQKLLGFISAVPKSLRIRTTIVPVFEFNFLCIHRELRGKRLTPTLISEITRRCNREGIWHALHTGGVLLPRPVSACRYFHRPLSFTKLCEVGFWSTRDMEADAKKYAVGHSVKLEGLREIEKKDVDEVCNLWAKYGSRFELAPQFDREDVEHWLLPMDERNENRVLWSYVVEDENQKITDFFSLYFVETSVLDPTVECKSIRVGYLFYYATETGLQEPFNKEALAARLNALISDAVILANNAKLDVLNATSMMDNALFLEKQKFAGGDGQLYYYISNYNVNPIVGGMNEDGKPDTDKMSGIGLTML